MAITPTEFADRWIERLLGPAVTTLAGTGKFSRTKASRWQSRLEGTPRLAGDNLADIFERMQVRLPEVPAYIDAARAYAEAKAAEAADPDGLLRSTDRLDPKLHADFAAIDSAPVVVYTWSPSVIASVMAQFAIVDQDALVEEAKKHDNGNHRLTRAELTAAARVLTQPGPSGEIGIVSDLDKTVIPPEVHGALPAAAYAGIAALMRELELGNGGAAGDMYYVTARKPERVVNVPDWLDDHGLPGGPISTGVSGIPGVAQREKVKDISEIMEAHPNQRFIFFGDTDGRDPEVYRQIQGLYPNQVRVVFIHRVNDNVPAARTAGQVLIENYAEAAAHLFGLGVFTETQARRVMNAARNEGLAITTSAIDALIDAHRP